MDFIYLLRVLLKRKWIIIAAAILAATLAWYLTRNEQRKFRSFSRISTGFAIQPDVDVNGNFDPWTAETKFSNAIEEFQTPQVLNLLAYELLLHDLSSPTPFRKLDEKGLNSPIYKAVNIEEAKKIYKQKIDSLQNLSSYIPQEKKLIDLQNLYGYHYKSISAMLSIFRVQRTDYLEIDALSEHPELSAFVVNNLFQQYLRYFNKVKKVNVTESIDTLKSILDKKEKDLKMKQDILASLSGAGGVETSVANLGLASELEQGISAKKSELRQKEMELKRVNQKLAAFGNPTSPKITNNDELLVAQRAAANAYVDWQADPSDKAKEDKYNRLNNVYLNLLKQSGPSTSIDDRPTESKGQLQDRQAVLQDDIQALNASINSDQSYVNVLRGQASGIATQEVTQESARRERDLANQEYVEAKRKYNDAMVINGSSINNFKQAVMAQPAIDPEPSKRKMIVGMAGAAALVTTMLIIIFLTYLDSSIKTPVIFSKSVNLKLISLVNFMDLRNKKLEDIVANRHQNETIVDRNKFNAFRESIRKLRYEIENTGKKVFLFTSTKKGQGKTTIIQALSYSMSLSKKKILIIDTNFCNPDLTIQLNADPILEKITPFKANGATLVDQVKKLSKDIGVGSVYAIGAEGGDYTPSEVLPRENILHHLQALTTEFDYIFLEGPPLNDFSDSKELAQYVDGVIAVFAASHIIKQIDKQSIAFFKELNGKFCGSILNMVDLKNVNTV